MTANPAVSPSGIDRAALRNAGIFFLLLATALLTRFNRYGDPVIYVDEQYYLLVADRMWQGAWPYVDLWDRKPILLFLIYAALRPLLWTAFAIADFFSIGNYYDHYARPLTLPLMVPNGGWLGSSAL